MGYIAPRASYRYVQIPLELGSKRCRTCLWPIPLTHSSRNVGRQSTTNRAFAGTLGALSNIKHLGLNTGSCTRFHLLVLHIFFRVNLHKIKWWRYEFCVSTRKVLTDRREERLQHQEERWNNRHLVSYMLQASTQTLWHHRKNRQKPMLNSPTSGPTRFKKQNMRHHEETIAEWRSYERTSPGCRVNRSPWALNIRGVARKTGFQKGDQFEASLG